jgi:hypothetical protein
MLRRTWRGIAAAEAAAIAVAEELRALRPPRPSVVVVCCVVVLWKLASPSNPFDGQQQQNLLASQSMNLIFLQLI